MIVDQYDLLKTPIADLIKNGDLAAALELNDLRIAAMYDKNSKFIPTIDSNGAPFVREDGMDSIKSMADGQEYSSRSKYYKSLKCKGYEIVGNEKPTHQKHEDNINWEKALYETANQLGY